jgi:hypothetical protein
MRDIVCGLSACTVFFHISQKGKKKKKKNVIAYKMGVLVVSTTLV